MIFKQENVIGKYKVVSPLGFGSFGETYLVYDSYLNRESVVKLFFAGDLDELLHEARIQTSLDHEYIVKVNSADIIRDVTIPQASVSKILAKYPHFIDIPSIENAIKQQKDALLNVLCIDMEHMQNGALGKCMERQFLSVQEVTGHMIKILSALEYMHNQNIIHKDIKPDNILLDGNTPKLADFGLSGHVGNVNETGYRTHMPPEYYKGIMPNIASDIYASGITLYQLANNFNDWRAYSASVSKADMINGKLIETLGFAPFIPEKLKTIIKKACHKDSAKRYSTVSEFKDALAKFYPSIAWINDGGDSWVGNDGVDVYKLSICHKKSEYHILVKKNNRKINADCKILKNEDEAMNCMYNYINESY